MKAPGFPRYLCLAVVLCAVAHWYSRLSADPRTEPLPREAVADFEWFSTLGFPDLRDCLVARVATGRTVAYNGRPPENQYVTAFLLHDDADGRFTVLTPELFTDDFTPTAPDTPEPKRVGFEKKTLAEAADAYLKDLAGSSPDTDAIITRNFRNRTGERAQLFVWAWACWRNGLDERAGRFYAYAAALPKSFYGKTNESADFRYMLEQDLSFSLLNRAKLDLGNKKIPRTRLLETFESIEHNYPQSPFVDYIHGTATLLRQMVAEDAVHDARPQVPLADLPIEQRVAELIFRLRDENWSDDVYAGTAAELAGKEKSPSDQLVAIGLPAVPQLIAALDDHRLSRTIVDDSRFNAMAVSSHPLTVGDCAENTLHRIAGRSFYATQTQTSAQLAQAWWKEVQEKGEKQALIDTVRSGGAHAGDDARFLQQHYPDEALAAIIEGTRNTHEPTTRQDFVNAASGISGDEAVSYLKEEMRVGVDLAERLDAARALGWRGYMDDAMAAMIGEWGKPHPAPPSENGQQPGDDKAFWDARTFEELADFLAATEKVAAIEALGKDLRLRSVQERMHVVMAVNPRLLHTRLSQEAKEKQGRRPDEEAKVNVAAEAILVGELEDTEKVVGMTLGFPGKNVSDPRVCDVAGYELADNFPGKYSFDLTSALPDRDRARIACLNIWRAEHGETRLPLSP